MDTPQPPGDHDPVLATAPILALLLAACAEPEPEPEPEPTPPVATVASGPAFEFGEEVVCVQPVSGMDRFTEEGAARGIDEIAVEPDDPEYPRVGFERMVVAEDVDLDGDVDAVIASATGMPRVHLNDGTGHFEALDAVLLGGADEPDLFALVDIDGNRLPDLVGNQFYDGAWTALSLGEGQFTLPQHLGVHLPGKFVSAAVAVADVDGDGDLDALLVADRMEDEDPDASVSPFLINEDGVLVSRGGVGYGDVGPPGLAVTFSDRDWDGDPELLHLTTASGDGLPTAFWERRGDEWVDIAPEVGADIQLDAMGVDAADVNRDGWLDYCASDVGTPVCLGSLPDGTYVRTEQAWNLSVRDPYPEGYVSVGWVVEFADLDNDGLPELVQASGYSRSEWDAGWTGYPDLVWQGVAPGLFEDVTEETGLGLAEDHYGLATADFDGDGWLDVLVAGPTSPPRLFMNACGEARWLQLELVGATANAQAIGARVEVETPEGMTIHEVSGPRASGQRPSRVHVGLGALEQIDRLRVLWPDGQATEVSSLPTNRLVTARHPEFIAGR